MPRRSTELHEGEFYHVYNRGTNRDAIFFERANYLFFLRRFREKFGLRSPAFLKSRASEAQASDVPHLTVLAYCLMPNHYHLLVRLESDEFSERMQAFGTSYSKAINKQVGRSGTLFQGRFQAKRVDEETYLTHLSRYIHLNPFEAGLVAVPGDWEFSSYREYVGERAGTLPVTEIVLQTFQSRERYRDFVEAGRLQSEVSVDHLLFDD